MPGTPVTPAVAGGGKHSAPCNRPRLQGIPQETGALSKQADATARELPRTTSDPVRKRLREARPARKLSRPQTVVAQIPPMAGRSSREPIQFRLAEGRNSDCGPGRETRVARSA